MKPWKQGKHGARLKDWVLTGPGGGVSRMPYAPEVATEIEKKTFSVFILEDGGSLLVFASSFMTSNWNI
jgi:hypothetical protein